MIPGMRFFVYLFVFVPIRLLLCSIPASQSMGVLLYLICVVIFRCTVWLIMLPLLSHLPLFQG
ncbi:hypothetical protein BJ170DRAFT_622250 [Xylariales sp. AK1849]|nr:hypothetical protein BJ170DRAFT_622250 [Xylariales sp. AK1849]